jgi:hypothetical protein
LKAIRELTRSGLNAETTADRSNGGGLETSSQTRCAVPAGTTQANRVSKPASPDDLCAELTRALADVDAGTLQAMLDALRSRGRQ